MKTSLRPRPPTLKSLLASAIIIVLVASSGCSKSDKESGEPGAAGAGRSERKAALASMADDVIVPGLEHLAVTTSDLSSSVQALCAEESAGNLTNTRESWKSAASAWASTSAYRFGPADRLKSAPAIAYPMNAAKIDKMFAAGGEFADAAPTTESVASLGADKRGLRTIEYLLFTQPDSIGGSSGRSPQTCTFISAAAVNVADAARALSDAWTSGSDKLTSSKPFAEQFRDPGSGSMYANQQEAIDDVINSMLGALASVSDMTLGPATGRAGSASDPNAADPAAADPGSARFALEESRAGLESVAKLYGSPDERLSAVTASLGKRSSNDADKRFRSQLKSAIDSLATLDEPIGSLPPSAASSDSGPLVSAYGAVGSARVTLRTEIASQLGVTVVFSDSDGDG